MSEIYEEDGPKWKDADGAERSGWPHDGFLHSLHRVGRDRFELRTVRRHIDGDEERCEERALTRPEALSWLAGRRPMPLATLEAHFPEHRDEVETVWSYSSGGREVAIWRLRDAWFAEESAQGRRALTEEKAWKRLRKNGCPPEVLKTHFPRRG